MVQISMQNSGGEEVFSGGFHGTTPLGHQREQKYLGHVSVKLIRSKWDVLHEKYSLCDSLLLVI